MSNTTEVTTEVTATVSAKSITRTLTLAKGIAKSNASALVRSYDLGCEIAVANMDGVTYKAFADAWTDRVAAWVPTDADDAALKLAVSDFGLSSKGTLSKYSTLAQAWSSSAEMLADLDSNGVPRTWTAAYKYVTATTPTVSNTETDQGEGEGDEIEGVDAEGIPMVTDAEMILQLLVERKYSVKSCQLIAQALVQLTSNMKPKGK